MFNPITPEEGSPYDYQRRTGRLVSLITQTQRTVCYDQVIYDDVRLEETELVGLTLRVNQERSSVGTRVAIPYHFSAIAIEDNDSEPCSVCCSSPIWMCSTGTSLRKLFLSTAGATVGWMVGSVVVEEGNGSVQLCVEVSSPVIECPINFPFTLEVATVPGTAGTPSPTPHHHQPLCINYHLILREPRGLRVSNDDLALFSVCNGQLHHHNHQ